MSDERDDEVLGQSDQHKRGRAEYFDFLSDFRAYIAEFVRESVVELTISEIPVGAQRVQLFTGMIPAKATIKNQGQVSCYITTTPAGGFRLDPSERIDVFVNGPVWATTASGSTSLGFVQS